MTDLDQLRGFVICERHAAKHRLEMLDRMHALLQGSPETQTSPNAPAFGRPAGEAFRPTGPEGPHTGGSCHASCESVEAKDADLLEYAWSIIANTGGGDWSKESRDWQDAAAKFRDAWIEMLKTPAAPLKREPTIGNTAKQDDMLRDPFNAQAPIVRYACSKAAKVGDTVKFRGIRRSMLWTVTAISANGYCDLKSLDGTVRSSDWASELEFVPLTEHKPLRYACGRAIKVDDRVKYIHATPRTESSVYRVTKIDQAAGFVDIASQDFAYAATVLPTSLKFMPMTTRLVAQREARANDRTPAEHSPNTVCYEGGAEAKEGDTIEALVAGRKRQATVIEVDPSDDSVCLVAESGTPFWKQAGKCSLVSRSKQETEQRSNDVEQCGAVEQAAETLREPAKMGEPGPIIDEWFVKVEEATPLAKAAETRHAATESGPNRGEIWGIPIDSQLFAAAEARNPANPAGPTIESLRSSANAALAYSDLRYCPCSECSRRRGSTE